MPLDPATKELSNSTKGRCLDISPDGKLCAIGFRDGHFRFYATNSWEMVAKKNITTK
jgi:hypothetical protein